MGRPFTTGSLTMPDGGLRTSLHVTRLRRLADKAVEQGDAHAAKVLTTAAQAMELLSKRNRTLGRELGQTLQRRVLTNKGASLRRDCPDTPAVIADLAADQPVTAYINHRQPQRVRVTVASNRLPTGSTVIGRFDVASDYREIARRVQEVRCG